MHLLAARPGQVSDGSAAVDLAQSPGDIVVLSAADSELACLAAALDGMPADFRPVRLASLLQLGHPLSVDLYVDSVVANARLVVVRLLGGAAYWTYGLEQVAEICRRSGIAFAALPGDDRPDPELTRHSTLPAEAVGRLWAYLVHGGIDNARAFLAYGASLIGRARPWREPVPLARAGLYWPGQDAPDLDDVRRHWLPDAPVVPVLFYRALVQAGNVAVIDALARALAERGLNPLPVDVASLKDPVAAAFLADLLARVPPDAILNATGFALGSTDGGPAATPLDGTDCPVFQVVFSGGAEADWRAGTQGLSARDIAMNVALPEVDGRVLTRAVSFKAEAARHARSECWITAYRPVPDRVAFVADLAAAWIRLRRKPPAERRVALVLANYPNRDGRLANGVGLDSPASAVAILKALAGAGYGVEGAPGDAGALMARLTAGVTNDHAALDGKTVGETLDLADYRAFFATLPVGVQARVAERWGAPEADPFVRGGRFLLPVHRFGAVAVMIQPGRGYAVDPARSYHDPDLVPPHAYLAAHAWLRRRFDAHAVVHVGKHGNLEWLPGKALALSQDCFPEAALGPLPNLYPFIVNDPGEGTQAKRRAAAVIVDHLTPPLTRAGLYGPLQALEALVDEYYEASTLDPRRLPVLRVDILNEVRRLGLDKDCGIAPDDDAETALGRVDAHLCDLKDLQIRDGLHVFGSSPAGDLRAELLAALVRLPRRRGEGQDAGLTRALAADLALDFDPLAPPPAEPWHGPRPGALASLEVAGGRGWRSVGDTVDRLEILALDLVSGRCAPDPGWTRTTAVLDQVRQWLAPALDASGAREMAALLAGLDGRFVAPGPSGAPTRGRPEVLPTGRNFFSVDTRAVPTAVAWRLGWASAAALLERHRQDHGEWPKRLALSAWGTANMRTGGDDIAQALALLGVRPTWDTESGRVSGFEILPLSVLDRPRIDVTLRVSGFFRDAFPAQIDLVDSAVRAVAALDEPEALNPLAARVRADRTRLMAAGASAAEAELRAGYRVFGSKPGAYGAGLQALIDAGGWRDGGDLADAYLAWGGYAYGAGSQGSAERGLFAERLGSVEAVLHNQDNREHDLLDSDDYYQFEGGLAATVEALSGRPPAVYHADHSRPETPRIRTLAEEIARVVRGRVVNPKWIAGVMRHGYKGAFEMAATVDYLFAFAATTHAVGDHQFDAVFDAYLGDEDVRGFLARENPAALAEMAARLAEALERGLWRPRLNSVHATLDRLARRGQSETGGSAQ